jgi:uncharacterized protein YuzE
MKNILFLALVFLALLAIPVSAKDADIAAELQIQIDNWISFARERNIDVVTSGQAHLDGGYYKKEIDLESGLYTIWGEPESSVDINDFIIVILDEDGKIIGGYSKLPVDWDEPWAQFTIDDAQTVSVELIISHDNGPVDARAAYIIINDGELTDQARLDYINIEFDNLTRGIEYQNGTVLQSESKTLTEDNNTFTFDYALPAGEYIISGVGGLVMSILNIDILNDKGDILFSDTGEDRWPAIDFILDDSETLTFKFTVDEFRDDYTDDYFCYCLSPAFPIR